MITSLSWRQLLFSASRITSKIWKQGESYFMNLYSPSISLWFCASYLRDELRLHFQNRGGFLSINEPWFRPDPSFNLPIHVIFFSAARNSSQTINKYLRVALQRDNEGRGKTLHWDVISDRFLPVKLKNGKGNQGKNVSIQLVKCQNLFIFSQNVFWARLFFASM